MLRGSGHTLIAGAYDFHVNGVGSAPAKMLLNLISLSDFLIRGHSQEESFIESPHDKIVKGFLSFCRKLWTRGLKGKQNFLNPIRKNKVQRYLQRQHVIV